MNFKGNVALVTGAAVGIGRATALTLAEYGADLVLLDLDLDGLSALREELRSRTDRVLIYKCDISDSDRVYETVEDAVAKFGKIDILVNNAAIWKIYGEFVDTSFDVWKKFIDVNVMGTVYVTKAVLPGMIDRGYGRIINVASVAGIYGNHGMAHYSATKGAVISFTKALAKEVVDKGVLVNSVSPGSVSPSNESDIDYSKPTTLSYMGRTGTDRENAELICFLASEKSSYISGENIQIDGSRKNI